MNQEEQRELAIWCGFNAPDFKTSNTYMCLPEELAAYTAAVEARERERCVKACEDVLTFNYDSPSETFIKTIMELK